MICEDCGKYGTVDGERCQNCLDDIEIENMYSQNLNKTNGDKE